MKLFLVGMSTTPNLSQVDLLAKVQMNVVVRLPLFLQCKLSLRSGRIDGLHTRPKCAARCQKDFIRHVLVQLGKHCSSIGRSIEIPSSLISKSVDFASKSRLR